MKDHAECSEPSVSEKRILRRAALRGLLFAAGVLAFCALAVWTVWRMPEQVLLVTCFYGMAGVLLLFFVTKTFCKRMTFRRRLKHMCRKEGYRLQYCRRFGATFFWSGEGPDFLLRTPSALYEGYFLTVRRYRATLFLASSDSVELISSPTQNLFSDIVGRKPKHQTFLLPSVPTEQSGEYPVKRVLLVNPVCREMTYKEKDGTIVATGSGAEWFGYTVFTATGFLENVRRQEGTDA